MKQTQVKIGIILINYNTSNHTIACIQSLQKNKYTNYKIYLIDNNSQKNEQRILKQHYQNNPKVKLIYNKQNTGFAAANNQGIKQALTEKCEYIWILNNDTEVTPQAISTFVHSYDAHQLSKQTLLTCTISYFNSNRIWSRGLHDIPWFNFPKSINKNQTVSETPQKLLRVPYASGCCIFAHKTIFQKHSFPDKYFMYFEDLDFCLNKTIISLPENLVKHKVSSSGGVEGKNTFSAFKAYYYARNGLLFYFQKKKISLIEKIIYLSITHWIYFFLYTRQISSAINYFKGSYDGLQKL